MRVPLYHAGRVALVLAVFAGAARAQDDGQGLMARLAANAGDISEASRDLTEGNITAMVPELLRRLHYSQHPFDAGISSKFLDRYLESLDGRHIYFLQSDLKQFEVYRTNLQTLSVSRHDYSPSTVIFARCLERVMTCDPGIGVLRHVDAGYQDAIDFAGTAGLRAPMRSLE